MGSTAGSSGLTPRPSPVWSSGSCRNRFRFCSVAHENGAIEGPHGHIKRAIEDALLLEPGCRRDRRDYRGDARSEVWPEAAAGQCDCRGSTSPGLAQGSCAGRNVGHSARCQGSPQRGPPERDWACP
ncbi:hypothetical protein FFK22_041485 [Mycobacterium sp. KBS0706]|nr:hypothetical protein FFK22_041485 [Mycobacterium sp. KBS0706]